MNQQPQSVRPEVKSERVRVSERSIVDVSKIMIPAKEMVGISTTSPTTSHKGGFRMRGFLGETSFVFIGLIVSIIALSISLWSIHRNSVVSSRLTEINSSVVDLIVSEKENRQSSLETQQPSTSSRLKRSSRSNIQPDFSQSQTIMERIKSKTNTEAALQKLRDQANSKPQALREAENNSWLQKIERETQESRRKAELEHSKIMMESNNVIERMKRNASVPPILPEPASLIVDPKKMFQNQPTKKHKEPTKPKVQTPAPVVPEFFKPQEEVAVDIDIDDLERDLAFLT